VTYPQAGHSYAINPGSCPTGAMLTTSFIAASHREQNVPAPSSLLVRRLLDKMQPPCLRGFVSVSLHGGNAPRAGLVAA
jgi:hypothetical protein